MFVRIVCIGLGVERNHWQQFFGIREHFFLNHRAQFFVTVPGRIFTGILCPGAQHKIDDFITKILGIGNARRFFDFFQVVIQCFAVETFAGIRVAEFLILYPEIGKRDVAIKNILAVFRIAFQVRGLNFLADKFDIPLG